MRSISSFTFRLVVPLAAPDGRWGMRPRPPVAGARLLNAPVVTVDWRYGVWRQGRLEVPVCCRRRRATDAVPVRVRRLP
jgi:hypothetical protein